MGIWTNAIFEGVAISAPFILTATPRYRKRWAIKGWWLVVALCVLLFILFSPFSFVGTSLDYVVCAFLTSIIVASVLARWVTAGRLLIPNVVIGVLVMLAYIPVKGLFGARVIKQEVHDGIVRSIIEVPDMVISSLYYEELHRRWFIFEQEVSRVPFRAGQGLAVCRVYVGIVPDQEGEVDAFEGGGGCPARTAPTHHITTNRALPRPFAPLQCNV